MFHHPILCVRFLRLRHNFHFFKIKGKYYSMFMFSFMFIVIVVNMTAHAIQELKSLHVIEIYFLLIGRSKSSQDQSTGLGSF